MLRTLAFLSLVMLVSVPVAAEEWHQIVPGRSTRQDVVREFGECPAPVNRCEFNLAKEEVYITLSGPDACPSVPEGTVLLIERELAGYETLASLNLDRKRFKKFDPVRPRGIGYQGYIDEKNGLVLKAFKNTVFQVDYIPAPAERKLCPAYYLNPKEFVEAYVLHAPLVSIRCPKDPVRAGELLTFKAEYIRGLAIQLNWKASAGKIVEGQGRRHLVLDTRGLGSQTITISIERADPSMFVSFDSCNVVLFSSAESLTPRPTKPGS